MNEFSGFQICTALTSNEKCIRIRAYRNGVFDDTFHEHVSASELAQKTTTGLLKTLVLRYQEAAAREIVQAYLTIRKPKVKLSHPYRIFIEYPEPGVVRKILGETSKHGLTKSSFPKDFVLPHFLVR